MPVPDIQFFFKLTHHIAADGREHSLRATRRKAASRVPLFEKKLSAGCSDLFLLDPFF